MLREWARSSSPWIVTVVGLTSTIPLFDQTSSIKLPFGGGISFLKNLGKAGENTSSLELEDQKIQMDKNKDYSEKSVSQIETKTEDFLDSKILKSQLETNKSQQDVTTIYSEVKKETEVRRIEAESQSKVMTTRSRLNKNDLQNFKKSLEKIKTFNGEWVKPLPSKKSKSISTATTIQKLEINEKKSISDFLNHYDSLNKDSIKFSRELSVTSRDKNLEKAESKECLTCISNNLKKIAWSGQDLNLFELSSTFRRHPSNPHNYYSQKRPLEQNKAKQIWGTWIDKTHPYYYFFSSESDWLSSVEKISKAWKSYHSHMNNGGRRFLSLLTMGGSDSGKKQKLEKNIDDAKNSLELQIGTKLMKFMNRLS